MVKNGECVSLNHVLEINNHFNELTNAVELMALNFSEETKITNLNLSRCRRVTINDESQ